ncbi:MAG TPA: transglycosylase domain-containing protein [Polyangiaceae bacterium LLY-WYZ-15_(1-7)]|nr:transglycosylase domain-containing protein [Polyangiaceae bacterium LLY-WYZ-15_(1-7)]HJL10273.1 transglycosylase domain-containing protein [Polyangiaceae bacterium LLY-WYZ-15_(1-7)]HJL23702.1 transglycosylase domain-containing protein [Polyangiaceae bacterium LLY-WYZ-15_(1-7)]
MALGLAALLLLARLGYALAAPHLIDEARFAVPRGSLTLTDRHGAPLRYQRVDDRHRRWLRLEDAPPHLVDAVLAAEDARFREHDGVDLQASLRALAFLVTEGTPRSGASTITQQTVKLVYGRPHGLGSKPLEVLRALALEERMDKDAILEQYLNRLPYAAHVTGVAAAAESYFGKDVADLDLGEAALLAGLPQAPTRLDPRRDLDAALARRRTVLDRMRRFGFIDARAHRVALASRPRVLPVARPWRAARFADRVLDLHRRGELRARDRRLRTSLDLDLQREAEALLEAAVDRFEGRGVTNGAAVILDNATGEVRAYVAAARRGPDQPGGMLDLLRARRQPGSTLKPFVYALLFERGGTPATVLDDVATPRSGAAGELFDAENYDGHERGPVRARVALASSLNLAAVDAASRVGAEELVARLGALGLRGLGDADRYGAAIALGGADVAPLDLARAYATLARGGRDLSPSLLPRAALEDRKVIEGAAAVLVADILRDGSARRDAFGRDLEDLAGGPFALKTGTSSGFRDAWSAAFTDAFTVVVWLGDPAGRPLAGVSGFEAAAPTAARLVAATRRFEEAAPAPPDVGLETLAICPLSGARPGPGCPHAVPERFLARAAPTHVCPWHRPDGTAELPPRYAGWQARVARAGLRVAPREDAAHAAGRLTSGRLVIVRPRDGARLLVRAGRAPTLTLRATLAGTETRARWTVDGAPLEGARWTPTPGRHRLAAQLGERTATATVDVARP